MRRTLVTSGLAGLLTLAVCFAIASAKSPEQAKSKAAKSGKMEAAGRGNADSITKEELKIYDYFLASDQLEGRNLPSRGYDTAALYVASHLAEWGLKPGGSTSGTNGPLQPYFMPIEMVTKQVVPEASKASITAPAPRGGRGGGGRGRGRGAVATELAHHRFRIRQGLDGGRRRAAARLRSNRST